MPNITKITAKPIANSKNQETLEVTVTTKSGEGVASVPAGTSAGSHEAKVLPVDQAIRTIEELISQKLSGLPVDDQRAIDRILIHLDGTERKEYVGGNTLVGVSMAVARAGAAVAGQPLYAYLAALARTTPCLPQPLCVLIEGGKHGISEKLTFQEFSVGGHLTQAKKVFDLLGKKLPPTFGLEGAYAPDCTNSQAISWLVEAVEEAGLSPESDVMLGLDMAATMLARPPEVAEVIEMVNSYPLRLLEDPLPEEAWHLWAQLQLELKQQGKDILLVGDDLFVTSRKRLEKGISELIANAILIKPNQIGTLTETLDVIALAKKAGFTHIVSHRSGETLDTFITDLAVATGAKFLKAGSPSSRFPERVAKYDRLAAIAKELA